MIFLPAAATLLAGYIGWNLICLERNAAKTKAIGVPFIRQPIDSMNVLWLTFEHFLWAILDRLPFVWSSYPSWLRSMRRTWQFDNKNHWHLEHGPVFALVSPAKITLFFADADAVNELYARRDDFIRPSLEYKILEVFGPCLSSAGWDDWPRHRKPTAAPFNETVMKFAWKESLRQAQLMAASWSGSVPASSGILSTTKDTRTFSLNVLAAAGFGQSYDFHGSSDGPVVKKGSNYRDALATILDNCILLMLVPLPTLKARWAPKLWGEIGDQAEKFMGFMKQMLEDERAHLNKPDSQRHRGIIPSFMNALDEHERHQKNKDPSLPDIPKNRRGLALEEVYSNLFMINFAGHDTTANTLAFAVYSLAAHPDVQDWVAEEIEAVIGDLPVEDWDYETLFPKLKRCRAVFYESLRLYPPVMAVPKWTAGRPQQLTVQGKVLNLPAEVRTYVYMLAIQTMPQYWPDPLTWKPSRWLINDQDKPASIENETFFQPPPGTFLPWSGGAQNCPGKKFADVEATAMFARLLNGHRVGVKLVDGESEKSGRERVKKCLNNVDCSLVLRMVDPIDTKLVYKKCT